MKSSLRGGAVGGVHVHSHRFGKSDGDEAVQDLKRVVDLLDIKLLLLSHTHDVSVLSSHRPTRRQRAPNLTDIVGLSGCVSSQRCPAGWRDISSRCYFLSTESKTWEDSRKYCQSQGADLVVINSEQEQRALYRLDGNVYLLFWIGLHHPAGTFKWVDGSALTKPFWQSTQLDFGGPNNVEDCVEMYHFNSVLANWNDAPCGSKRRWLCERSTCQ
ncbi:C-type lectin domain family 17, member A-like [Symphorus nematophorus]